LQSLYLSFESAYPIFMVQDIEEEDILVI
jgi:hypothetical protein